MKFSLERVFNKLYNKNANKNWLNVQKKTQDKFISQKIPQNQEKVLKC